GGPAPAPAPCRRVSRGGNVSGAQTSTSRRAAVWAGRSSEQDADGKGVAVAAQRDAEADRPALTQRDVDAEVDREVEIEVVIAEATASTREVIVIAEARIHHQTGRAVGRERRAFGGQRAAERDAAPEAALD